MNAEQELDLLMAEPAEDKDVVLFTIGYPNSPKTYTYAAVRTRDAHWYVTGEGSPQGYLWKQLIAWFKHKDADIHSMHLATGWEAML